jgi:hypothetical protein
MELLNLDRPLSQRWWREQDSNLRRQSQKIYSLPPLATWVSLHLTKQTDTNPQGKESWLWDSNPQPADYKSAALPIELNQHKHLKVGKGLLYLEPKIAVKGNFE